MDRLLEGSEERDGQTMLGLLKVGVKICISSRDLFSEAKHHHKKQTGKVGIHNIRCMLFGRPKRAQEAGLHPILLLRYSSLSALLFHHRGGLRDDDNDEDDDRGAGPRRPRRVRVRSDHDYDYDVDDDDDDCGGGDGPPPSAAAAGESSAFRHDPLRAGRIGRPLHRDCRDHRHHDDCRSDHQGPTAEKISHSVRRDGDDDGDDDGEGGRGEEGGASRTSAEGGVGGEDERRGGE